uniref:Uncharacterized protein n=1 Tax=Cucumis melo TaxID=3656 RepID=A0A9I9E639_CUCME
MLASSRPRSFTGVPDLGETKQLSDNSSRPKILPGHHDPFRRRTQTNPPTDESIPLASLELPISKTPRTQRPGERIPRMNNPLAVHLEAQSVVIKTVKNLAFTDKCIHP